MFFSFFVPLSPLLQLYLCIPSLRRGEGIIYAFIKIPCTHDVKCYLGLIFGSSRFLEVDQRSKLILYLRLGIMHVAFHAAMRK